MKSLLPNRKKSKPQIIVTNLIDIILLLVFFFMITSSFATNNEKMPVNLPRASSATTMETDNLSIQIDKEGQIFIKEEKIDVQALREKIKVWVSRSPDRPVMVEADKSANYGEIITALDIIRNSGAINIGLATIPDIK